MEHRTMFNVPPRIGSAPLSQPQQSFQRMAFHNTKNFLPAPPRPGGEKQPSKQQQQQQTSASASPPAENAERGTFAGTSGSSTTDYPENCIYNISEFVKLQHTKESPPNGVLAFASALWKEMPENKDSRPEHILSREELFQGESVPSKVMSERRLHNEVLGILGRVSDGNLEKMKKELTDLPIRQSTDEEIQQVIQVIFNKSIQPEDSIFVPHYVKLVSHLISDIGENEAAGRHIRNAIIRQCQHTFEHSEDAQAQLEREIVNLPEEEAEQRRLNFAGKQKANINFLGLLFTHGLVRERVVLHVLDWLLYGSKRKRRIPADYELIHFMNLLVTCGKYFSSEGQELVPKFRDVLEELMRTHPQRRMQFLLLNTVETIDNGWAPRYGPNADKSSQENETERRPLPPVPPRNKAAPVTPSNPIPPRDCFWAAMDKFFVTSSSEEVILLLADIPEDTRIAYCTSVIHRYITTVRYGKQRARLGELFEELANKRVLPVEDVRNALLIHLRDAVREELFTDIPKYFSNYAAVIKGGRDVFPQSLHTDFLNILVDSGVSREKIVSMVRDVHKVQSEGPNTVEADPKSRFRVLPALLRYTPPLFSGYVMDESEDILRQVSEYDTDVSYFCKLCEEEVDSRAFFMLTNGLGKAPQLTFSMISALFTFIRFDVHILAREYKETLKKLMTFKQLHLLLEEVYVTWLALDRTPEDSFPQFVEALRSLGGTKEQIDKFKAYLTKNYGATGKKDALLLNKGK
ncbi:MIF4G-like [Trypanosoma melophagium]|uniref:MIF4G-like n=1 Tax=Trypanosoma melophagium TaxID=715481 RepID=UPI003519F40A|nr:MIF4G-like [Trypanosoma melophagium]